MLLLLHITLSHHVSHIPLALIISGGLELGRLRYVIAALPLGGSSHRLQLSLTIPCRIPISGHAAAVFAIELGDLHKGNLFSLAIDGFLTFRVVDWPALPFTTPTGPPRAGVGSGCHLIGFLEEGCRTWPLEDDEEQGTEGRYAGGDDDYIHFQSVPQQVCGQFP